MGKVCTVLLSLNNEDVLRTLVYKEKFVLRKFERVAIHVLGWMRFHSFATSPSIYYISLEAVCQHVSHVVQEEELFPIWNEPLAWIWITQIGYFLWTTSH